MKFKRSEWMASLALLCSMCTLIGMLYIASPLVFGAAEQQTDNDATLLQPDLVTAISNSFNYQGILRNSNGQLLTGVYTMTLKIYSSVTGGSPLFTQTTNNVNVKDGVFNVVLGNSPSNPLGASVFANAPRYLGIAITPDVEMTPRQEIHAVPWALMANNATTALTATVALNANTAIIANEAASVLNASITTEKIVEGAVTATKLKLQNGKKCLSQHVTKTLAPTAEGETFDIPELSLTFSLQTNSNVLIWMNGLARYDHDNLANIETTVILVVDGTAIAATLNQTDNLWSNLEEQRLVSLSPGEHQISVRFLAYDSGTAQIHGTGLYATCVNYLVLGN